MQLLLCAGKPQRVSPGGRTALALQPAPAGRGYDRFGSPGGFSGGGTPGRRGRKNDPLAYRQVPIGGIVLPSAPFSWHLSKAGSSRALCCRLFHVFHFLVVVTGLVSAQNNIHIAAPSTLRLHFDSQHHRQPASNPTHFAIPLQDQHCYVDDETREVVVQFHDTDIVRVNVSGDVKITSGGFHTVRDFAAIPVLWALARRSARRPRVVHCRPDCTDSKHWHGTPQPCKALFKQMTLLMAEKPCTTSASL